MTLRAIALTLLALSVAAGPLGKSASQDMHALPPEVSVTAYELFRDYQENEVAADARYKDRVVEISGMVNDIAKDIAGTPYITFNVVTSDIFSVQCMFPGEEEPAFANVRKFSHVVVKGRVYGKFGNVLVEDCVVVRY